MTCDLSERLGRADPALEANVTPELQPGAPLCYRVRQVAAMLNLPISTVHDMVRRRTIESVRIGEGRKKLVLIPVAAVEELLARYRVAARGKGR